MTDSFKFWLFHIPNVILAAALYTLIGRYILSLFFRRQSELVIWRVFCQITDPIVAMIRAVTPAVVPGGLLLIFGIVWILILRIALLLVATIFRFLPTSGG
jgi:uncharacterized protein YggT (Ycf19 family)